MATEQVPQGTVADITAWMGSDPARAQAVIDAENASGSPRSTLVEAAQRVVDSRSEDAVSEETTTEPRGAAGDPSVYEGAAPEGESEAQGMTFEELEPVQPPGALSPVGATVTAVELFPDENGELPDHEERNIVTGIDYEADEVDPFDGEPVTSLQAAGGPGGAIVAINGVSYVFSAGQLGTLSRLINRAGAAAS